MASKEWRDKHPEAVLAHSRRYYQKHKERLKEKSKNWRIRNHKSSLAILRKAQLKTKFGMTEEDFNYLLECQNGVCAICFQPERISWGYGRLSVDHDHKTGKVRGLLCFSCNILLGRAKDDPAVLRSAITYLTKFTTENSSD